MSQNNERSERPSEGEAELAFFWGPDLSNSLQGAGGVGGLVAVSIDGFFYFPGYDNNGNVIGYWDESGSLVAEYAYDAFGNTISSTGSMASVFPHRFSTKYYDSETSLYYYGYRYYSPSLGRWISRDPIGERDLMNLYAWCRNNSGNSIDVLGLSRWILFYYSKFVEPQFRQAAETEERAIRSAKTFNPVCDDVLLVPVFTSKDFRSQWEDVRVKTSGNDPALRIREMHFFTHSSLSELNFRHTSFRSEEVVGLSQLNWDADGVAIFHGCNSGLSDGVNPSMAEAFASAQGITAYGQDGFSQFSENENHRWLFSIVNEHSKNVFLWSYGDGGHDNTLGHARPVRAFSPEVSEKEGRIVPLKVLKKVLPR